MIFLVLFLLSIVWIGYEIWKAPLMDEQGNVIEREKKLSDLFKK